MRKKDYYEIQGRIHMRRRASAYNKLRSVGYPKKQVRSVKLGKTDKYGTKFKSVVWNWKPIRHKK